MPLDVWKRKIDHSNHARHEVDRRVPPNTAMGYPQDWTRDATVARSCHEQLGRFPIGCMEQIDLSCVEDIQVMEFATRRVPGKFVKGLGKCIEEDRRLDRTSMIRWKVIKESWLQNSGSGEGRKLRRLHQEASLG